MNYTPLFLCIFTYSIIAIPKVQAAFIEDSKADIRFKNYYFDQDQEPTDKDATVWGQGIELSYQSGFTDGAIGVGLDATAAIGIRLDGSKEKAKNSTMFPLDDDGSPTDYWTRAFPTLKARYQKTEARIGELRPDLPILGRSFARLLDSAYLGGQITSKDLRNLTLTGGYITKAPPPRI